VCDFIVGGTLANAEEAGKDECDAFIPSEKLTAKPPTPECRMRENMKIQACRGLNHPAFVFIV